MKRTRDVSGANFRLAERIADKKDCTWYGEAYCHGDEVIVSHVIFSSLIVLVFYVICFGQANCHVMQLISFKSYKISFHVCTELHLHF